MAGVYMLVISLFFILELIGLCDRLRAGSRARHGTTTITAIG
jgi:hypothetical protein